MVTLPDGRVLVIGGRTNEDSVQAGTGSNSCEVFDPATQTFSSTGPMATGRYFHRASLLPSGKVGPSAS